MVYVAIVFIAVYVVVGAAVAVEIVVEERCCGAAGLPAHSSNNLKS